jgi:hypothetical protein
MFTFLPFFQRFLLFQYYEVCGGGLSWWSAIGLTAAAVLGRCVSDISVAMQNRAHLHKFDSPFCLFNSVLQDFRAIKACGVGFVACICCHVDSSSGAISWTRLRRRRVMAMSLMAAQMVRARQRMSWEESGRMQVFSMFESRKGRRYGRYFLVMVKIKNDRKEKQSI